MEEQKIRVWCLTTGQEIIGVQEGESENSILIRTPGTIWKSMPSDDEEGLVPGELIEWLFIIDACPYSPPEQSLLEVFKSHIVSIGLPSEGFLQQYAEFVERITPEPEQKPVEKKPGEKLVDFGAARAKRNGRKDSSV